MRRDGLEVEVFGTPLHVGVAGRVRRLCCCDLGGEMTGGWGCFAGLGNVRGYGCRSWTKENWKSWCATDRGGACDERAACEFSGDGMGGSILCPGSTAANGGVHRGVF